MIAGISRLSLTLFFADLLLTPISFFLAGLLRSSIPIGRTGALPLYATVGAWPVFLFSMIAWAVGLIASGAYDPHRVLRWHNEVARVLSGALAGTAMLAGALYFTFRDISRLQVFYFLGINLFMLLSFRAILRIYHRIRRQSRPGWRRRILILGAGDLGRRVAKVILDHSRWGLEPVGYLDDDPEKVGRQISRLPVLSTIEDVQQAVETHRVDEVWVALPARSFERLNRIVTGLERLPVRIKVVPDYYSLALVQARAEIFGGIPLIGLREPIITGAPRLLKRVFDLIVASILLIAFSPIFLFIGLMIRIDSPGPVIFRQKRAGENAKLFDMYKFRTMRADAEAHREEVIHETPDGGIIHKRPDDPRVTRVGRFLRRYSLDELPQLFNVLKGEMSLVGPRPEMPWLVDRYDSWQRKRFAVPQGITGWWQINGRSDKPMHLHTEDDLYYVYNWSLWLDILILLRTPIAVIQGKGAF